MIKPLAGTVVHNVKHSQYWTPFDAKYGNGGSDEFPFRYTVEKRISNNENILRLKNKEVRIEPTNRCNYSCVMCPRDSHDRVQGVMPLPFFTSIVDEVSQMGASRVVLTNFGEPFLDPGLEDKIFYCTQKNISTYVVTNASRLYDSSKAKFAEHYGNISKIEAAIHAGLKELRLSFYGTTKEAYESIMKGGKYEQVRDNILKLIELRKKLNIKGISPTRNVEVLLPEISIYYLDLPQNKNSIQEFLDFTKDLADYIEVWKPHNFGLGNENIYRDTTDDSLLKSCGRPANGPIQINWQGIVVPCCYDYNQSVPLGNAALQTIEEILRGEPYQELKRCHKKNTFECVPYCNRCDQLREHSDAVILTTNAIHSGKSADHIVRCTNTQPAVVM
jgi:MoaA/NifB/PqqE/SkfB family radical SAM enzyme